MRIFIADQPNADHYITERIVAHLHRLYRGHSVSRMSEGKSGDSVRSNVILVILGPDWLTRANAQRQTPMQNVQDPLRVLLAQALQRNQLVVPVLVNSATMPNNLPEDLAPLSLRQARVVRPDPYFRADMDAIYNQIDTQLRWRPASIDALMGFMLSLLTLFVAIGINPLTSQNVAYHAWYAEFQLIMAYSFAGLLLATIARVFYLIIKRQSRRWIWVMIGSLCLLIGEIIWVYVVLAFPQIIFPLASIAKNIPFMAYILPNVLILMPYFAIILWFGILIAFILFGPRAEKTRSIL